MHTSDISHKLHYARLRVKTALRMHRAGEPTNRIAQAIKSIELAEQRCAPVNAPVRKMFRKHDKTEIGTQNIIQLYKYLK